MTLVKMVKHKWQSRKTIIKDYISASQSIASLKSVSKRNKSESKELSLVESIIFLFKLIFI